MDKTTPGPETPLPWKCRKPSTIVMGDTIIVGDYPFDDSRIIASDINADDAIYIVHACNSLPALSAENARLRAALDASRVECAARAFADSLNLELIVENENGT